MNSCLSVYALQYDVFLDKAKENIKSICRSPSKENFPFFFFFFGGNNLVAVYNLEEMSFAYSGNPCLSLFGLL